MTNLVLESDVLAILSKIPLSVEKPKKVAELLTEYITGQVADEVDRILNLAHSPPSGADSTFAESPTSAQMASKKKLTKS